MRIHYLIYYLLNISNCYEKDSFSKVAPSNPQNEYRYQKTTPQIICESTKRENIFKGEFASINKKFKWKYPLAQQYHFQEITYRYSHRSKQNYMQKDIKHNIVVMVLKMGYIWNFLTGLLLYICTMEYYAVIKNKEAAVY